MLSLPGDELPPTTNSAPTPGIHGLIETTSNLGVAGDDTGFACNNTLDSAAIKSVAFISISPRSSEARADRHFERNQLVGGQVAVMVAIELLQRRGSVIDLPSRDLAVMVGVESGQDRMIAHELPAKLRRPRRGHGIRI